MVGRRLSRTICSSGVSTKNRKVAHADMRTSKIGKVEGSDQGRSLALSDGSGREGVPFRLACFSRVSRARIWDFNEGRRRKSHSNFPVFRNRGHCSLAGDDIPGQAVGRSTVLRFETRRSTSTFTVNLIKRGKRTESNGRA